MFAAKTISQPYNNSLNFPMALTSRILFGLVNGNIGTLKTYLGEITDRTNQARAFSFVGMTFGLGSIIGPCIGGLLARPCQQYPDFMALLPQVVVQFLNKFPFILPNLFVAMCSLIALVIGAFKLDEQARSKPVRVDEGMDQEFTSSTIVPSNQNSESSEEEESPTEYYCEKVDSEPILHQGAQNSANKISSLKIVKLFRESEVFQTFIPLLCCFLNLMIGFVSSSFDEVNPLFSLLPPR